MWEQLLLGGVVSLANFGIHALVTGIVILLTHRTAQRTSHLHVFARVTSLLTVTMIALMGAHVIEIAVWGAFYRLSGSTPEGMRALEFAFENYTALGYGNPLPAEHRRLIGPMTALNGLLLIGWSVAIIFEVMRMAELQFARLEQKDES